MVDPRALVEALRAGLAQRGVEIVSAEVTRAGTGFGRKGEGSRDFDRVLRRGNGGGRSGAVAGVAGWLPEEVRPRCVRSRGRRSSCAAPERRSGLRAGFSVGTGLHRAPP